MQQAGFLTSSYQWAPDAPPAAAPSCTKGRWSHPGRGGSHTLPPPIPKGQRLSSTKDATVRDHVQPSR